LFLLYKSNDKKIKKNHINNKKYIYILNVTTIIFMNVTFNIIYTLNKIIIIIIIMNNNNK